MYPDLEAPPYNPKVFYLDTITKKREDISDIWTKYSKKRDKCNRKISKYLNADVALASLSGISGAGGIITAVTVLGLPLTVTLEVFALATVTSAIFVSKAMGKVKKRGKNMLRYWSFC